MKLTRAIFLRLNNTMFFKRVSRKPTSTVMTSRNIYNGSKYGKITSSSNSDSKTTVPTSSFESFTSHLYLHYKNTPTTALTEHKGQNSSPERTKHRLLKTRTTNANLTLWRHITQVDSIHRLKTALGLSSFKTTRKFDSNNYS
ncbi:hypothetical protein HOLleu_22083 [Holothuria leucospilota]|uniref:Uncharacterized protein n=1 Tax=Holothuria leucospilota TaxID=206669 RepID=A0A9Q1H789_HOLLE|nr:hypothetical protein HOLleu_22083 [Holothuria leucospilota]